MLNLIGIYGWRDTEENLFFASMLTGDPTLIIGDAGTAKTALVNLFAASMKWKFGFYDAAKSLFEDVIGFPNPSALRDGKMEYIESPITIWDKDIVLIDELNRAAREMQSKWLEIIRSRKIMGLPTNVKFVVAAMNPFNYSATNALDDALIGRFASYIYAPDIMSMSEKDVIKISRNILSDDAPALSQWGINQKAHINNDNLYKAGAEFTKLLNIAGKYYLELQENMPSLPEFLARLFKRISQESNEEISVDGRRLGFIYRTLLATRAIELAKVKLYGIEIPNMAESAEKIILSCLPIGLSESSINKEKQIHIIVNAFKTLSAYFDKNHDINILNTIYELFTTPDMIKRASILFNNDLGEFINHQAWKSIIEKASAYDIALIAYVAMQLEIVKPNSIPKEFMSVLSSKINIGTLGSLSLNTLSETNIDFASEIVDVFDNNTTNNIKKLIAFKYANEILAQNHLTIEKISSVYKDINKKVEEFYQCLLK